MIKRTKIVATLGPATDDARTLEKLLNAGLDVARLNYSHGNQDEQTKRIRAIRRQARGLGKEITVIADLQGPKIRICQFKESSVTLKENAHFVIDTKLGVRKGTAASVGVTYKNLAAEVTSKDILVLDDGRIVLKVLKVSGSQIVTKVLTGGILSNNKGINKLGGGLSAASLTSKDKKDLKHAVLNEVDYIAISFPRCADDILYAKKLIKKAGGNTGVIAKIERAEALDRAEEIIEVSDCIMVARGDLGVEIGDERLPPAQKMLIKKSIEQHKAVITATQMMESMIKNPIPTRAEVSDVANAILDGTDAVMLSGETSIGANPIKAVEAMARACKGAEDYLEKPKGLSSWIQPSFKRIDQAVAMSAIYCSNRIDVKAIAALTESGLTALWMSRVHTTIPIFAISRHRSTLRKVTLFRNVYPIAFDVGSVPYDEVTSAVLNLIMKHAKLNKGDKVMITKGDFHGSSGGTNGLKIVQVGDFIGKDD